MSDETWEPGSPHPLFLPEREGEDAIEIFGFSVERTVDGETEVAGRSFAAKEILTHEQIASMWGGGTYTLKARNAAGKLVTGGKRTFQIDPGAHPPRPLIKSARKADPPPPAPVIVQHAAPQQQAPQQSDQLIQMFGMMLTEQRAASAQALQQIQATQAQQMQLVAGILQSQTAQNASLAAQLAKTTEAQQTIRDGAAKQPHEAAMELLALAKEVGGMNPPQRDGFDSLLESFATAGAPQIMAKLMEGGGAPAAAAAIEGTKT